MRENTQVLRLIASKATVGTKITSAALVAAANILAGSPKWNEGNLLPGDHAGVLVNGKLELNPSQSAQRADYLFHKVSKGLYEIVASSAYTPMPQTSGTRAKANPEQARKDALALLGVTEDDLKPKATQATQNKPVSK